jgi:hypothetical protein
MPGLANATLRELAPLLAKEGIDVDDLDVPDSDTLQQAMDRAVERQIVRSSGARRPGPRPWSMDPVGVAGSAYPPVGQDAVAVSARARVAVCVVR